MKPRLILVVCGMAGSIALLSACGIRHKEVHKQLETSSFKENISLEHYHAQLVTEQFGGTLKGGFLVNDTSDADSSEVESNGIKVKVKVTKGKPGKDGQPGKMKVSFEAEAKPVARSSLTVDSKKEEQKKEGNKKALNEQVNKSVNSLSGWVWFGVLLIVIGIVSIVITRAKKKLLE